MSYSRIRYALTCLGLLLMASVPACAQQEQVASDTLEIRFQLDEVGIDMAFDGNAARWQSFLDRFNATYADKDSRFMYLDIYAGASPEGSQSYNRRVGEERAEAIRGLIYRHLPGRIGNVTVHNEAARWEGLYRLVEASDEPWRDEVLSILRQPSSINETGRDRREWLLRHLRDGSVWQRLLDDYMPALRSGGSAVVRWIPERDTLYVKDTVVLVYEAAPCPPSPAIAYVDADGDLYDLADSTVIAKPVIRKPVWVLRTNLPFLAVGTPNLQAEWSLGHNDRWSFNIEGLWSWWTFSRNAFANQLIYGSAELRHWLGPRYRHHTLAGWHIGLGIGAGYGDIEWKSRGYQAEVYSGFLNIGWQGRFGKNKQWAFDAGIGLGYAYVPWRRYRGSRIYPEGKTEEHDDHLMWKETGRNHWIGAPHANISIGYVFPQKDAEWRRAKAIQRSAERSERLHLRDNQLARERYTRDSLNTALKMRKREIALLPADQRIPAYEQYFADKKQMELEAKEAQSQAKLEAKAAKRQEGEARKRAKRQLREEKASYLAEKQRQRELARTPEGKAAMKQQKALEKAQRKQAKADAKAAKRQAKLDRKREKIRSRIDAEQQRHINNLRRELEQSRMKYKIDDN